MPRTFLTILLFSFLWSITGCVSMRREELSSDIGTQELSAHVHFLAQPTLKGRSPGTWESATVRQYLKSRFQDYGLVPWLKAKGYEQSFGYGTNVIGILPGSDPNLADEIVLLSAHYDHLGKHKKGIYHGASDNASGVAVLLETAERFALTEQKPKRSVCFAAFDCEESFLLGSFAFTCREDFNEANIVAVVNVDTLGRNLFDVVENTLCAVGTMEYPKLRKGILKAGNDVGIDIAIFETDFVGPRGDHVPFESMTLPCLFFTCGQHCDYHMPSDITDNLNYEKVKRSADVIFTTVCDLVNTNTIEQPATPKNGDTEELKSFKLNLGLISENYEKAGLTEQQGKQVARLCAQADELLRHDNYSVQDRRRFMWEASCVLGPLVKDPAAPGNPADTNEAKIVNKYSMATLVVLYAAHRNACLEGTRKFVKHLLKYKPGLFKAMPKFEYEAYELNDDEISLVLQENGKYLLAVLPARISVVCEFSGWLFRPGGFRVSFSFQGESCEGTKEQIIDFCLLQLVSNPENDAYFKAWQKVLVKITEVKQQQTHDEWIQRRIEKGGWENEKEWVLSLMRSDNPHLAVAAISRARKIVGKEAEDVLCEIIRNNDIKPNVRAKAIQTLSEDARPEAMLTLVDMLDDNTPSYSRQDNLHMRESYPFHNHPGVRMMNDMLENRYKEEGKSMTLGSEAEKKLRGLTKKDFGKDIKTWRKWVDKYLK